jgi:hypothetical protein
MSTNLYMEAIRESHELKAMAEQNAKNKIIEALTPKIQAMVEAQLLSEQPEDIEVEELDAEDSDEWGAESVPADDLGVAVELDPMALTDELIAPDELVDDEDIEVDNEAQVVVNAQGDVSVNVSENSSLSRESVEAVQRLIRNSKSSNGSKLTERNVRLRRKVRRMDALLEDVDFRRLSPTQRAAIKKSYTKLLREMINLRKESILSSNRNAKKVRLEIFETLKEMNIMTNRRSRAIFNRLFEAGVDELDEMEIILSDDDLLGLGVEDDILDDLDALDPDALAADVEVSFAGAEEEAEGEELEDEGMELEDEGEELEDEGGGDELDLGEVYEIDPRMLKMELRKLRQRRRLSEQEVGRAAAADPSLAHGGEDEGDVILDVNEDDLINALADELGDPSVPTPDNGGPVPAGDAMPESYRRRLRRRRVAEQRRRRGARASASRRTRQNPKTVRENRALKRKLSEMNLFNAKLLYVNKLMQNRNVSSKQQRAIVEALDSAKTVREAKLVYDSLTRSLKKRSLSEGSTGRRVLGSSSRPTRRGSSSASESGQTDRWAVLAGIDNK